MYPNLTWSNSTAPSIPSVDIGFLTSSTTSSSSKNSNTLSAAAAVCCITLAIWAVWAIGCINDLTYWMNASISPTCILFLIAKKPPIIATITYPKLPINVIIGIIIPDKNCDFQAELYNVSLNLSNSSIAFSSPLKAFIILWPLYISSICPLVWPKYSCCALKCFWDFFTTNIIITKDKGITIKLTNVIVTLIDNIIIKTPIRVVADVIICDNIWFKFWLIASMSFVTLDKTSPLVFLS